MCERVVRVSGLLADWMGPLDEMVHLYGLARYFPHQVRPLLAANDLTYAQPVGIDIQVSDNFLRGHHAHPSFTLRRQGSRPR